jgi:tetratricopeptide (TPR) repeat protein
VKLKPDSPEAGYDLAMVQSVAGFKREAMETLERGIQRFPRDAMHYQAYASFLVDLAEGGDAAAEAHALSVLHTAIFLDGTLSEPHYLLGRLDLKENHVNEAVKEFEFAAKLTPRSGKIHWALSRAYRRLGLKDKAENELDIYKDCAKEELKRRKGPSCGQLAALVSLGTSTST